MITIASGLRNSLIVLELLRSFDDLPDIHVGTFTNCREQGLTFCVSSTTENGEYFVFDAFTWCVYEHRNSDEIIINGKKGLISMNGDLPYMGESKWEYLASFSWGEYSECATKLADFMQEWARKGLVKAKIAKKKREKEAA